METVATAPAETGHALLIERVFDAPPALVFRLWSDPARVKEWWHPENFETERFDMDFRVGGSYRFNAVSATSSHSAHGVYREIVAPERIVMTFEWEGTGRYAAKETLITIEFAPHGDRQTLLRFRQEPFGTRDGRDDHVKGWSQVLDSFAATLAGARS
jgi:uncharacterized protein YndB with AHSA1/START domain